MSIYFGCVLIVGPCFFKDWLWYDVIQTRTFIDKFIYYIKHYWWFIFSWSCPSSSTYSLIHMLYINTSYYCLFTVGWRIEPWPTAILARSSPFGLADYTCLRRRHVRAVLRTFRCIYTYKYTYSIVFLQLDGVLNDDQTPYLLDLVNSGSQIIPDFDVVMPEQYYVPGQRELLYVPGSNWCVMFVWGEYNSIEQLDSTAIIAKSKEHIPPCSDIMCCTLQYI